MKRVFITSLMALIFTSSWQALSLNWPFFINMVFLPPIILVFSLQNFKMIETIIICLFVGLIVDSMGGFLIGVNMLLMLIMSFVLLSFNLFNGRISQSELIYYVIAISFIYRVLLLIGQLVLIGQKTNILLLQLVLGPALDGLLSGVFYFILIRALVLVHAFDRSDFLRKHSVGKFR